jgi:hypothetical protein
MRIAFIALASAAVVAGCAKDALAQTGDNSIDSAVIEHRLRAMLGTMSVAAEPSFANGELSGCTIGFNAMALDRVYKQSAYIWVRGAFGVMAVKEKLATILKVTLHDVDPRTAESTPSAPTSAYFISGNATTKNAVVGSYPSDTPGTIFVVSNIDPTFSVISEGLLRDKVTIAFARKKGGTDIGLVIDTSVTATAENGQRTHSPQASADFAKCIKTLLGQTIK